MQLKPLLLQTMTELGITPEELDMLRGRMLSSVTSLQAGITSLDAQISTLQGNEMSLLMSLMLLLIQYLSLLNLMRLKARN